MIANLFSSLRKLKHIMEKCSNNEKIGSTLFVVELAQLSLHSRHNLSIAGRVVKNFNDVSVWAGPLCNHMIGSFFIEGNLNIQCCLQFLRYNCNIRS